MSVPFSAVDRFFLLQKRSQVLTLLLAVYEQAVVFDLIWTLAVQWRSKSVDDRLDAGILSHIHVN